MNEDRKYNPLVHVFAGGAAGAVASAFTTPLDVIKTLLNTQETGVGLTKGMREAISQVKFRSPTNSFQAIRPLANNYLVQIYRMAGPLGFFKGLHARVLYSMPATAICWSTYEFFKYMLSSQTQDNYRSSVSGNVSADSSSGNQTTDKKRTFLQDDSSIKPKRFVIATEIMSDGTTLHHSSSTETASGPSSTLLPTARELTSISGAGVYNALSLNTMHTEKIYDPISRGCTR